MAEKALRTKMKIFQTVQNNMAAMGFASIQQQNNHHRQMSFGPIIDVILCSIDAISVGVYIFREANGIEEYMVTIFTFTVLVAIAISFVSIIFKNDKIFNAIEFCANEINDRK